MAEPTPDAHPWPPAATMPRSVRIVLVGLAVGAFPAGLAVVILTWWNTWSWLGVLLMGLSAPIASVLALGLHKPGGVRPAMRRYTWRLALNMVVYLLVLDGATLLYQHGLTRGPLGYLIAIAPAIPVIGILVILGGLIREESDELLRKMILDGLVWSGALTLCEATIWGFLETFGKAPHVWMWAVPVAFFAQLGITVPLSGRRYR
ncbi:MAG: hypothetical protein ACHP7N_04805 [Caulobacterales bacterium]